MNGFSDFQCIGGGGGGGGGGYLVLELGDLPLTGRVVLHVVQHDLGIGQQGLGPLQVLTQPLLRLNVHVTDLL